MFNPYVKRRASNYGIPPFWFPEMKVSTFRLARKKFSQARAKLRGQEREMKGCLHGRKMGRGKGEKALSPRGCPNPLVVKTGRERRSGREGCMDGRGGVEKDATGVRGQKKEEEEGDSRACLPRGKRAFGGGGKRRGGGGRLSSIFGA